MPFKKYLVFYFTLALFCGACTASSDDKLSVTERQMVDTLYTNRVKELRPLLDSICEVQQDSLVARVADSLIQVRMAEIDRIMNRK